MINPGKHQLEVVEKFVGLDYNLIGDSMGVGKTLSAILLDFMERNHGQITQGWAAYDHGQPVGRFRTLIVCTKGGLSVWKWHLEDQGVPSDRILVIDPSNRDYFDSELNAGALSYDYYIMHYHALPLLTFFDKVQLGRNALVWNHIIADEAHLIKNRKAERTKILKRQKAKKKTAVSGTPADDKPLDIWSVLNWLDRSKYSSYWRFYNTYIKYIEEWNHNTNTGYRKVVGTKNMDQYHREIHPFYIRRTLPEVRGSMPPKTHSRIWVDLSERQLADYKQMQEFQTAELGVNEEELTVLWQIAVYQRLQQMTLGTVIDLDWSAYKRFWDRHEFTLEEDLPKAQPKGPKLVLGDPSPKMDAVMEKIEEALDVGESIVVLSQYVQAVKMMEARCKKAKVPISLYHGGMTSQKRRDASVADFQSRTTRVFLGTIAAAGTSITLTAARTLLFTDRHWNPSVNRQAEDRIWRFDTEEPVQIIDIAARETVDDEKLAAILLKGKRVDALVEVPDKYKGAVLL
jgi:SNF2 family DNA or RNA helicase